MQLEKGRFRDIGRFLSLPKSQLNAESPKRRNIATQPVWCSVEDDLFPPEARESREDSIAADAWSFAGHLEAVGFRGHRFLLP